MSSKHIFITNLKYISKCFWYLGKDVTLETANTCEFTSVFVHPLEMRGMWLV